MSICLLNVLLFVSVTAGLPLSGTKWQMPVHFSFMRENHDAGYWLPKGSEWGSGSEGRIAGVGRA